MKQPKVSVHIITEEGIPDIDRSLPCGWGDSAEEVIVIGSVLQITVKKEGKAYIGLRILENGSVTITNYAAFSQLAETNIRLEPQQPWQPEKPKRK